MKNHSRGFTLIELLVVIAIIGLLSSVVLASLNTARSKARDARRASDMNQIKIALELYRSTNGLYPPTPVSPCPTVSTVANLSCGASDITPYIPIIPADPVQTGNNNYRYYPAADRNSYTMLIFLEKDNGARCYTGTYPGYTAWQEPTYLPCDFY